MLNCVISVQSTTTPATPATTTPASEGTVREGWLHVKQTLVEQRRSTDRSWRQLWAKLRAGQLRLWRDRKDALAGAADELAVDLRGSTCEVWRSFLFFLSFFFLFFILFSDHGVSTSGS